MKENMVLVQISLMFVFCFFSPAAFLTFVNAYSVKWAARLMTGLSSMKIIAMAMVVVLGVWHFINKGTLLKPHL